MTKGINQALMTAIVREMPEQPNVPRDWFALFRQTAIELRQSFVAEFGTASDWRPTIKAFDKIINHYQIS